MAARKKGRPRKAFCAHGHAMTPKNTAVQRQWSYKGYYVKHYRCITCRRIRDQLKYRRDKRGKSYFIEASEEHEVVTWSSGITIQEVGRTLTSGSS